MDLIAKYNAIPIIDIAHKLGLSFKKDKTFCFNGHDKKSPSLSIKRKGNYFKCFGCGIGGDSIKLVMEYHNYDFKSALHWLSTNFPSITPCNSSIENHTGIFLKNKGNSISEPERLLYKAKLENKNFHLKKILTVDDSLF
jgi:DNA primase